MGQPTSFFLYYFFWKDTHEESTSSLSVSETAFTNWDAFCFKMIILATRGQEKTYISSFMWSFNLEISLDRFPSLPPWFVCIMWSSRDDHDLSGRFLIDLETYFKAGISGDLIGLSRFADAISLGFWNSLKHFSRYLRELIFAITFSFFKFLRELIFGKMAIPNISHELKLANFAKY